MLRSNQTIERVLPAARLAAIVGVVIAVIGLTGHYVAWPLISAALGPTVYVFAAHPNSESTRVRNAMVGHIVGASAGLASLAAFGLWNAPALIGHGYVSWSRVGAVVMAIMLTLFVLELVRIHHPPAGATSLLISTGLAHPGSGLYGLLAGLALVILIGPMVSKFVSKSAPVREGAPSTSPDQVE